MIQSASYFTAKANTRVPTIDSRKTEVVIILSGFFIAFAWLFGPERKHVLIVLRKIMYAIRNRVEIKGKDIVPHDANNVAYCVENGKFRDVGVPWKENTQSESREDPSFLWEYKIEFAS